MNYEDKVMTFRQMNMKEEKEDIWGFRRVNHIWRWWELQTIRLEGAYSGGAGAEDMPGKVVAIGDSQRKME